MTATRKKKKSKEIQLAEKLYTKLSKPENLSKLSAGQYTENVLNEIINGSSNHYNITTLSSGNNKNFIIAMKGNDNVSLVLQATSFFPDQPTPKFLDDPSVTWKAEKYTGNILFEDRELIGEYRMLRFIEKCPLSLAKQIETLHEKKPASKDNIFKMTCDVGVQISSLLDTCEKQGAVWTDIKTGNFLLRENNEIAVADLKGFKDANSFETVVDAQGRTITLAYDITQTYVSEGFLSDMSSDSPGRLQLTSPGNDMLQLWGQEYSYQLSSLLYNVATGEKRILLTANAPELTEGEVTEFNFNQSPFIDNEQGQLLKFVLENLSREYGHRMVHTDAAKILNVISNEEKFNAAMNSVPNREALTNDKKIAEIANVILTDDRFKLIEANAAQPEAPKSESKKTIFQRIMPFGSKTKTDKYSSIPVENSQPNVSAAPEEKAASKRGGLTKHLSFKHGASKPQISSTSASPKEAVAPTTAPSRKLESRSLSSSNIFQMLGIKKTAVAPVNANTSANTTSQSNSNTEPEIQSSIKFADEPQVPKSNATMKSDNATDTTNKAEAESENAQNNEPPRNGRRM